MTVNAQGWRKLSYVFFALLSILIAAISWRFVIMGMESAFPHMAHQLAKYPAAFLIHVTAGPLALLILPAQFSGKLRAYAPRLHRWLGRIYCGSVLLAGTAGLINSLIAGDNMAAKTGFGLLALSWLATTYLGYSHARKHNFSTHRVWMMRSAALTFAAVTLRLWLPLLEFGMGLPFALAYPLAAWLCWVPNLIFVELHFIGLSSLHPGVVK